MSGVLSCVLAFFSDTVDARQRAWGRSVVPAADELAASAGLTSAEGDLLLPSKMQVNVVQADGPLWAGQSVEQRVSESVAFERGQSAHLLRTEAVENGRGFAVQLRLNRAGWDLRLAEPVRRRMQPELFAVALALGIFLVALTRRLAVGVLSAGVAVLLLLAMQPIGGGVPGWSGWFDELRSAPLWSGVANVFARHEQIGTAIIGAIIVFCVVLAYFDHRRSESKPDSIPLPIAFFQALAIGVGGLFLVEGALRSGWWDGLWGLWGLLGALAMGGACVAAGLAASRARAKD